MLMMRDYLEVIWENMSNPRWKNDFDLIFRAIFDDLASGNRMIGPPALPYNAAYIGNTYRRYWE